MLTTYEVHFVGWPTWPCKRKGILFELDMRLRQILKTFSSSIVRREEETEANLTFSDVFGKGSLRGHHDRQRQTDRSSYGLGLISSIFSEPFIYLDKSADFQIVKYHYSFCLSEEIADIIIMETCPASSCKWERRCEGWPTPVRRMMLFREGSLREKHNWQTDRWVWVNPPYLLWALHLHKQKCGHTVRPISLFLLSLWGNRGKYGRIPLR